MIKVLIGILALSCISISCLDNSGRLNVAVASNAQFAIKEIAKEFEKTYNTKVNIITGSSGKLSAKIKQGAPYDIFVSADLMYPQDLTETGYSSGLPEVYASGLLVCLSSNENIEPDITNLTLQDVEKISIANPKTAPYGRLAVSALESYNIYDQIEDKLVFGESVSQATQFVTSKSADIGIVAKSLVVNNKSIKGKWKEVSKEHYIPIAQAVVMINRSNNEFTMAFYDFLFSDKATDILRSSGYQVDLVI